VLAFKLNDRVESAARWFAAHAPPQGIAHRAQRQGEGNTFEIDWIENGSSASPAVNTSPAAVTTAMPKRSGDTQASGGI
jgi:hypothetical protein